MRGADEEVSAKLEIGLHKVVVLMALEILHPTVCGDVFIEVWSKVEIYTIEVFLVVCHMAVTHCTVVLLECFAQDVFREDGVVAADVVVVFEVGGDGNIDNGIVGSCYAEHAVLGGDSSSFGGGSEPSCECHLSF